MAFTLRSADAAFAEAMRWHLEPFQLARQVPSMFPLDLFIEEDDRGKSPPPYSLFVATSFAFSHPSLIDVLQHALWAINQAVQKRVRDYLLLHAGAVARHGKVVFLPAAMESGKSSLVLALIQQGFEYLSDEFGAIDPVTGNGYPVPKRIALGWQSLSLFPGLEERLTDRAGLNRSVPTRFVRPEDVQSTIGIPGEVATLVFPTSEFEGPPRLIPITSAEAVKSMAECSFNLFRYQERGVILLSRIAQDARAYRLEGGTPQARAELIADKLS
jgi:hypothetical protein